jgi:hypothetical protein
MTSHAGGAHDRIRTGDLVLTKDTLCRLSYVGAYATRIIGPPLPPFKPAAPRLQRTPAGHSEWEGNATTGGREDTLDWIWWVVALALVWFLFFRNR